MHSVNGSSLPLKKLAKINILSAAIKHYTVWISKFRKILIILTILYAWITIREKKLKTMRDNEQLKELGILILKMERCGGCLIRCSNV